MVAFQLLFVLVLQLIDEFVFILGRFGNVVPILKLINKFNFNLLNKIPMIAFQILLIHGHIPLKNLADRLIILLPHLLHNNPSLRFQHPLQRRQYLGHLTRIHRLNILSYEIEVDGAGDGLGFYCF